MKHFEVTNAISAQQLLLKNISEKMREKSQKEKHLRSLQTHIQTLQEELDWKEKEEKFEFESLLNEMSTEQMLQMASMNSLAPEKIMMNYTDQPNPLLFPRLPEAAEALKIDLGAKYGNRLSEMSPNEIQKSIREAYKTRNVKETRGKKQRLMLPVIPTKPILPEINQNEALMRLLMNPMVVSHKFKARDRVLLEYLFKKNAENKQKMMNQVFSVPKMFHYPKKEAGIASQSANWTGQKTGRTLVATGQQSLGFY